LRYRERVHLHRWQLQQGGRWSILLDERELRCWQLLHQRRWRKQDLLRGQLF
jgi:hypothetical protein